MEEYRIKQNEACENNRPSILMRRKYHTLRKQPQKIQLSPPNLHRKQNNGVSNNIHAGLWGFSKLDLRILPKLKDKVFHPKLVATICRFACRNQNKPLHCKVHKGIIAFSFFTKE